MAAIDEATGVASQGESRAEALSDLADAIELHEGGGDPIEDPDTFLREELDIDVGELDELEPPGWSKGPRSHARFCNSQSSANPCRVVSSVDGTSWKSFALADTSRSAGMEATFNFVTSARSLGVRNVTVPMYDEIPVSILQKIADHCGAEDFSAWCEWIEAPL